MKIAFTTGFFDILTTREANLIKEMYKAVCPDGRIVVYVLSDLSIYNLTGSFPKQTLELRMKNLRYLANDIRVLSPDEYGFVGKGETYNNNYVDFVNEHKGNGHKPICVAYRDDPLFFDKEIVNVPIRIIKDVPNK